MKRKDGNGGGRERGGDHAPRGIILVFALLTLTGMLLLDSVRAASSTGTHHHHNRTYDHAEEFYITPLDREEKITSFRVVTRGDACSVRFVMDGRHFKWDDLRLIRPIESEISTTFAAHRPENGAFAIVTLLKGDRMSGIFAPYGNGVVYEIETTWSTVSEHARRPVGPTTGTRSSSPVSKRRKNEDDDDDDAGAEDRMEKRLLYSLRTTQRELERRRRLELESFPLKCSDELIPRLRPPEDPFKHHRPRRNKNKRRSSDNNNNNDTSKRGLRQTTGAPTSSEAPMQWSGLGLCYPEDFTRRRIYIGVAVDASLVSRCASVAGCEIVKLAEMTVARANAVFVAQFNVEVVAKSVVLPSTPGAPSFLASATRLTTCSQTLSPDNTQVVEQACCADHLTLSDRLETLREWYASGHPLASKLAHWHLLTDCHPSPGYVGRSFIGTLCHATHGAGVTSYGTTASTYLWRIFTHELGHAFNATHAFENGIGTTGGIMDYGDGLWDGIFQFDPMRRDMMCEEIASQVDSCIFAQTSIPTCGDGVLEPRFGEECECPATPTTTTTTCAGCVSCRLTGGVQCIPGSTCCSTDGKFLTPAASCMDDYTGERGICVRGTCQSNVCPFGSVPCGESAECAARCCPIGSTAAGTLVKLPDGLACKSETGTCQGGVCQVPGQAPPAPGSDGCVDYPRAWWDSDGTTYGCAWYGSRSTNCLAYAATGRNFGYTAAEACCACGGGRAGACPPAVDMQRCASLNGKQNECQSGANCVWCAATGYCVPSGFQGALASCSTPYLFFSTCRYRFGDMADYDVLWGNNETVSLGVSTFPPSTFSSSDGSGGAPPAQTPTTCPPTLTAALIARCSGGDASASLCSKMGGATTTTTTKKKKKKKNSSKKRKKGGKKKKKKNSSSSSACVYCIPPNEDKPACFPANATFANSVGGACQTDVRATVASCLT